MLIFPLCYNVISIKIIIILHISHPGDWILIDSNVIPFFQDHLYTGALYYGPKQLLVAFFQEHNGYLYAYTSLCFKTIYLLLQYTNPKAVQQ